MSSALIGILGVVLGVLLSNIAARLLEYVRRRERIQDVSTAIRAEIRSHRQRLLLFKRDGADSIVEHILESPDYTPFVPREGKSFILDAIVGDIQILPTDVIDPVIYYYRQIEALGQFAGDLRSDRFATLEPQRKAEMYRVSRLYRHGRIRTRTRRAGHRGARGRVSSRAWGRSARRSGSGAVEDAGLEPWQPSP